MNNKFIASISIFISLIIAIDADQVQDVDALRKFFYLKCDEVNKFYKENQFPILVANPQGCGLAVKEKGDRHLFLRRKVKRSKQRDAKNSERCVGARILPCAQPGQSSPDALSSCARICGIPPVVIRLHGTLQGPALGLLSYEQSLAYRG